MKTKHTLAPWKIDESTDYTISVHAPWSDKVKAGETRLFGDYRGGLICEMRYNSGVPTKDQALANAKLIAAAPELLKIAIEYSQEMDRLFYQNQLHEQGRKHREEIHSIIKKAIE